MNSDKMDILVEDDGDDVEISLRGTFDATQVAALREKMEMLLDGPGCFFFLNLQKARFIDDEYKELFLSLLNYVRKRNAALILIFHNKDNEIYFSKVSRVFDIYESRSAYRRSGLLNQLKVVGINYTRKTGLRLSPSVAIAFLVLLMGWFFTLFSIIKSQNSEILERQIRIMKLENQKARYVQEIDKLQSTIGPLRNLSLVSDSTIEHSFANIRDWVVYLDYLETSRREK